MQKRKANINNETLVIMVLSVVVALVMLVSYIVALSKFADDSNDVDESEVSSEVESVVEEVSEAPSYEVSVPKDEYDYYDKLRFTNIDILNADVTKGALAIIKAKSSVATVSENDLVRIGIEKEGSYGLKDMSLVIRSEVMPNLDSFLISFGEAVPDNNMIVNEGYLPKSNTIAENDTKIDLCTGYSVQFSIYGSSDKFSDAKYAYLYEQASKFGFIQRFPANKTSSTGFELDYKTYRYVGIAHSSYMRHYNYSLEEYIDKLKTEKVIERKADDGSGNAYVMYYIPKTENATTTSLPVPEGYDYEISGDGSDGFVITVTVTA